MTVTVDYGAGSIVYDVEASEAFTSDVSDHVQARGDGVYSYLLSLDATAESNAQAALDQIEELRNFAATAGSVNFNPPDGPNTSLEGLPVTQPLTISNKTLDGASLGTNFSYRLEDAVSGSWDEPDEYTFTVPDVPNVPPGESAPTAPPEYDFPEIYPPSLTVPEFTPDNLTAPLLETVDLSISADLVLEDFTVNVDTETLLNRIEQMRSFNPVVPTLPDYTYLIPEIFTVTGSMAGGDVVVDYVQLLEARNSLLNSSRPSTAPLFERRGLYVPPGASTYDSWLDETLKDKLDDSDTVFEAVAIDDCVKTSFQLGAAAHRLLVDIEIALYDLEFAAARAAVNAQIERAKSVVAIYNAEVLVLRNQIAEYNAEVARVEANAQGFLIQAEQARLVGQSNALTADVFAAEESVKGVDADVYRAHVQAERTKLRAYRAEIESHRAAVASAEAAVATYAGSVSRYTAEVDRVSNEFDTYAARMQGTQFANTARATAVRADQSNFRSLAAAADASATAATATAIDLQARSSIEGTQYIKKALEQDEQGVRFRLQGANYDEAIGEYVTELQQRTAGLSQTSQQANSVSRYVQQAQEALGRAAQLTQTANLQIAKAYETVYEAAGRAGAAVATGKLSGFRASANMDATEALRASNSYGVGYAGRGTNRYEEYDQYSSQL